MRKIAEYATTALSPAAMFTGTGLMSAAVGVADADTTTTAGNSRPIPAKATAARLV